MAKYYNVEVTITVSAVDATDAINEAASILSKSDVIDFAIEETPVRL